MKGKSYPHPSPLPEGEGADRGVLRGVSTWKILVVMGLVKGLGDYGLVKGLGGYGFGDSGTSRVEASLTPTLSRRERGPTELSCGVHRPGRP